MHVQGHDDEDRRYCPEKTIEQWSIQVWKSGDLERLVFAGIPLRTAKHKYSLAKTQSVACGYTKYKPICTWG